MTTEEHLSPSFLSGASALACVIGMIVFLILAVWHHSSMKKLLQEGVTVQGVVTDIEEKQGRRGRIDRFPVVRFTTEDGKSITTKTPQASGFSIGQEVEIVYFPDNPEKAEIRGSDSFSLFNFYTIATAVFLIMAIFFGVKSRT